MHLSHPLLAVFLLGAHCADADILYSEDLNIVGFGGTDEIIFFATFSVAERSSLDGVSVDMTHNYAAELELSLTSPETDVFYHLQRNGLRSRVGDGSGTLAGAETYNLIESGSPLGGVAGWGPGVTFRVGHTMVWSGRAACWPLGSPPRP